MAKRQQRKLQQSTNSKPSQNSNSEKVTSLEEGSFSKKRKLAQDPDQQPKKLTLWEQLTSPLPNNDSSGGAANNGFRLSSLWETES